MTPRIVIPAQAQPRVVQSAQPGFSVRVPLSEARGPRHLDRLKLFGTPGPQGQPGEPGQVAPHVHTQAQPLATWTVNHNLGRKPIVSLFTVGGVEIFGHVTHVSDAQFTASFAIPTAGQAICL